MPGRCGPQVGCLDTLLLEDNKTRLAKHPEQFCRDLLIVKSFLFLFVPLLIYSRHQSLVSYGVALGRLVETGGNLRGGTSTTGVEPLYTSHVGTLSLPRRESPPS